MRYIIRLGQCAFCLLLFAFSSAALAGETSIRSYLLPDHGRIHLQVPVNWDDQLRQPPMKLPPTIEFRQKNGVPFKMLITTIWPAKKNIGPPNNETLHKMVKEAADRIAARSE